MKVRLEPIAPGLAAFDEQAWAQLDPPRAELLRLERGALLALAASYEGDLRIASAWSDDERTLLGLSVGYLYAATPGGPLTRTLSHPATLDYGPRCRGLKLRADVDGEPVAAALVEAWKEQCRTDGIRRLTLVDSAPDDEAIRRVALALGGREFGVDAKDWAVRLDAPTPFEEYLGTVGTKWRNQLRRDLRRAELAGAVIERAPATPELLARIWPLQLEHIARRGSRLTPRPGVNGFAELAARTPPANLELLVCRRGDAVLGFILNLRAGPVAQFLYSGHVEGEELHVYVAMLATMLKRHLDEGVTQLFLGYHAEESKRRLGATPVPRVHFYFPVT